MAVLNGVVMVSFIRNLLAEGRGLDEAIREGAVETGGLGGVWLVKTMVVVAGALMILQGIAAVLRPGSEPQS